jgi:hypothetical protein
MRGIAGQSGRPLFLAAESHVLVLSPIPPRIGGVELGLKSSVQDCWNAHTPDVSSRLVGTTK